MMNIEDVMVEQELPSFYEVLNLSDRVSLIDEEVSNYSRLGIRRLDAK